jgi:RimJ/RimL family protein N-acetyltransferase
VTPPASGSRRYAARSACLAMRPLDYPDVQRVVGWLQDASAMRDVLPLHVTPTELDVVTLIEYAQPTGSIMSWAFDLPDGTPTGFGSWREDMPWTGVYHIEVVVPSIAPDRIRLVAEAYRLLARQVFATLPARKVSAKSAPHGPSGGAGPDAAGMRAEGVLRGHALLDGIEHDLYLFGMSRAEWSVR